MEITYLVWFLAIWFQKSSSETLMEQSPDTISVPPGETFTIKCKASTDMDDDTAWYHLSPGKVPKLLIYEAVKRAAGVPSTVSGSGYSYDFTFTVQNAQSEHAGEYYCQQHDNFPLTFGKGTKVEIKRREDAAPSAFIFQPSAEEISGGKATLVCLINNYYPGDLQVTWKADGTVITKDAENSANLPDTDNTYSRSSMVTFTKAEWESHNLYTCEVNHKALSLPLIKSINRKECV